MLSPFLAAVIDPRRGTISPKRVGKALHLPITELAKLAKLHRNTMAQRPDSPAVQARLGDVARIIAAAADLLGGDSQRAIVWFRHQPLASFDGRTAAELVTAGRADAVLVHLELLRDGVYA